MKQSINDPPNPNTAPPAKQKPKSNFVRNIVLLLALVLLISAVLYAYFDNNTSVTAPINQTQSANSTAISSGQDEGSAYKFIYLVIIIGLAGLAIYFFFKAYSRKGILSHKIPVKIDRAILLFKSSFAIDTGIECRFDKSADLYLPVEDESILVNDRIPFFHTHTGDSFLCIEVEVRAGNQQGTHSIFIPTDKGEEEVKTGNYRIDTHVSRFQIKLQRNTFPMSCMADKQDRMKMAILENSDSDRANEIIREMLSTSAAPENGFQNRIGSPIEGEEGYPGGMVRPYQRPVHRYHSRYNYRRRY